MDKEIEIHGKIEDLKEFMYILGQFVVFECTTLEDAMKRDSMQWAFKDFKISLVIK